jgi:competence protein ComEA
VNRTGGHLLLTGVLLLALGMQIDRVFFSHEEDPVFFIREPGNRVIELGSGFPEQGIHQIIDGSTWRDVIKLTMMPIPREMKTLSITNTVVQDGQKIDLVLKNDILKGLSVSWMSAARRVALGIPLHPDRMDLLDWQFLPGIGERTAQKIVSDRQNNGDFVEFSRLMRVQGIGKKRLTSWNQYFFPKEAALNN